MGNGLLRYLIVIISIVMIRVGAQAEEPATDPPQEYLPVIVLLGEEERREATEALTWAISSQLADLPVQFHTHWIAQMEPGLTLETLAAQVAEEQGAQLVVWCDLDGMEQISLHFAHPEGGHIQSRGLASAGEGEEVRFETIAVIARAAAGAVVAEGPPPEETTSVADAAALPPAAAMRPFIDLDDGPPPPPPPKPPPPAGSISAGGKAQVFSAEYPVSVGFDITGTVAIAPHWDLLLGYGLRPGIQLEDPAVELRLTAQDIRVGLAVHLPFRRVEMSFSLAAELGLHHWGATARTDEAYAAPDGIERTVGLQLGLPQFSGPLSPGQHLWWFCALRLSVPLLNQVYDVTEGDELRAILTPLMVQPTFVAGLTVRSGK